MEIKHLDLCEIACPMALLLAKRAACQLTNEQELRIDLYDPSSIKDIFNYLHSQGFTITTQKFDAMTRFVVTQ